MDDNMLIVCRDCGRKTLMHNMRPDDSGENIICNECFRKKNPIRSVEEPATAPAASKSGSAKSEQMMHYICTSCKYKFSRKKLQEVSKCPYCGKQTIVVDSQLGAAKLLNDSLNDKYDTW